MAVDGDLKARFEASALPLMHHVYTAAFYLTRNRSEAEDLLQETYLRAYRFFHRFTPGTNVKAWLLTILYNVLRNRYRHRLAEQRRFDFAPVAQAYERIAASRDSGGGFGDAVFRLLVDGEIERALVNLPHDFRAVVLLVDVHELSYAEAAAALGCPVGTIRSRLSRARRLLQVALHDYAREHGLLNI
ncbi:MAG: sigma-70 family RNA polymerase sigma factor [Deltaproteobacteria bacterium]|nr:sigma-70 family RNA polymerase sigma factor [Deltaproteobacteria bacterium]